MQQIIQLKAEDDIAAIRARIEMTDLSYVVLIVPQGCAALDSNQGMQLLRRAAEDAGVELAVVSSDDGIRERAAVFGLPVFSKLAQAQRARWEMNPLERELVQGAPKLAPARDTPGPGGFSMAQYKAWSVWIVTGVAVSCLLCVAVVFLVPTANIRLVPASLAFTVTTDLTADPSISQNNNETRSMPARRITQEISGTAQLKTTTEQRVPNAPSTGTVIFSNLRTEETLVPQGTIVKTSAGVPIRFTTSATVTIPAGVNNRVEAPIQAMDPGPTGNVKELAINTIEGSLSLEARVINTKATASGSLKPVKVVTADDKKKLEAQLVVELRKQATAVLQKNLKGREFLPAESVLIDVDDETFDHAVDDPSDVLGLKITASAYGLAVDRDDAEEMVRVLLSKQMQAGYTLIANGVQVEAQSGGKYQGIALKMPIRGVGYATPQVDTAKLARALQGKTTDQAVAYLGSVLTLAQPPDIKITPPLWNRIPLLQFRTVVSVEPQTIGTR